MAHHSKNINPNYRKSAIVTYTIEECLIGLETREYKYLSYLLSKAESNSSEDRSFVKTILDSKQDTSKFCKKIAISGAPGVGKSTFIDAYGSYLTGQGYRVAVLPVDPTSHISKGSILGDKTRMDTLSLSDKAYIKPMSSGLISGGVAASTFTAIEICELAEFDYIIIETVGVGQSEFIVRNMVDMFILLLQPGGGDDLQGIKRGIMEMADLLIVTKADGSLKSNAMNSVKLYKNALSFFAKNNYNWKPQITIHSSIDDNYNDDVNVLIESYYKHLEKSDLLKSLRTDQKEWFFKTTAQQLILEKLSYNTSLQDLLSELNQGVKSGTVKPAKALHKLELFLDEKKS